VTVWESRSDHEVTVVERGNLARWKCSCGASMGGQWCKSSAEAEKRASRHLDALPSDG
jgi:hypothetical protein